MMWGIKKALILIALLILNTYTYAAPAIQNYAQGSANDVTVDSNPWMLGIMPESASLLLLGAGLLFFAIYVKKRFGRGASQ